MSHSEALADQTVTVEVGPLRQVFYVHKRLLCDNSEYFRAALMGSFVENVKQSVKLPEDDPKMFHEFVF